MVIEAKVISKGSNGRTAQVVMYLGDGRQKRSVTVHVRLANGRWMGYNPDHAAVARLDMAEKELEQVRRFHARIEEIAKLDLAKIAEFLGRIKRFRDKARGIPRDFWDFAGETALYAQGVTAETIKKDLGEKLQASATILKAKAEHAAKLVDATPREVEFKFAAS